MSEFDAEEEVKKFFLTGCLIPLFYPLVLVGWLINGYVLSKIWAWIVVPTFNLEPITLVGAMTICLVTSMLNNPYHLPSNKDKSPSEQIWQAITAFSRPWWFLLMAYVLKWWM